MYRKTQVFVAACIGLFLFGMILISLGSILPSLKEKFVADGLNTGILASIFPIGILAGSLIFGPIVDRYGYKLLLIVSVLISAIAMEGLAFSGSLPLLGVCIFSAGFGGGIINGGTNALVADISEENKGANLSLLGVFFGIGAFGLPFLLGVLSKNFDYSSIISAVGLFMLFPVIYFILIRFPSPKLAQGFPLKEGIRLLKEPALLLTALFLFFQSGVESLINNWTTSFLHDKLKMPGEDALYALSFSLAGLTIARLLLGILLKKISSFVVLIVSLLLVGASSFILLFTTSYNIAFAALIIIGAGLAAGFPVILGYIGQLYISLSGTAFSISLVIALAGNTFLNYLFGIIARKYTIAHLPLLVISCILCMIVLLVFIKQKIKTKVKL
jgi:FHS family glucose/mannose:H+ symporter-like MFS transporter